MPNKYEIAFRIAGELSKDFAASFKGAGSHIVALSQKIKEMDGTASGLRGLINKREEADALSREIGRQRLQINALKASLDKGEISQAEFNERSRELNVTLDRSREKADAAAKSMGEMAREMGKASTGTLSLREDLSKTAREAEQTRKVYERVVAWVSKGEKWSERGASMRRSAMETAVSMRVVGAQIANALATPVKSAMKMEDAMADVAKVVQFKDPKGLENLRAALEKMSLSIPMSADGLAQIAAAAGQSGIAAEEIEDFTRQAAKMGVAFGISAGQAGEMMAKWRAGMALSQPQAIALANVTNALADANAAQASQIGQVLLRYGALGKVAGLTEKQVAALSASVIGAGAAPEVAATGINAFVRALGKGATMTKKQAEAFGSIGFNVTQLQKDMQKNAPQVIVGVLQRIRDKVSREQQASFLTTAFGEEGARTLGPLLTNLEGLRENFKLVESTSKDVTQSMEKEFEKRSKTTSNSLILLQNSIENVFRSIGDPLLQPLAEYARDLANNAAVVGDWIKEHKELVAVTAKTGIAIGGVAMAAQGLKAALLFTLSPFASLVGWGSKMVAWAISIDRTSKAARIGMLLWKPVSMVVRGAFSLMGWSVKGLGVAFTAVGVKAKALGAALMAFSAKSRLVGVATSILGLSLKGLGAAFAFVGGKLKLLGASMLTLCANPVVLILGAIAAIVAGGVLLYKNWDTVKEKAAEFGAWLSERFTAIKDAILGVWDSVKGIITKITDFFTGKKSATYDVQVTEAYRRAAKQAEEIPEFASGGIVTAPTVAMVGEGNESEAILPLSRLSGMLSQRPVSQASPVNVTFSPVINLQGAGQDAYESVRRGVEDAQREFETRMRRFLADQQRLSFA